MMYKIEITKIKYYDKYEGEMPETIYCAGKDTDSVINALEELTGIEIVDIEFEVLK